MFVNSELAQVFSLTTAALMAELLTPLNFMNPLNNSISKLAVLAGITLSSSAYAVVTFDWVDVGDVNNSADPATGSLYGSVGYEYKIAKNEVTISQYAEFLNAAAKTDTFGLWNSNMGTNLNVAGITRSGSSGNYSYSVTGSGLRPITYVSWYDAARFTNWLHNGQGSGSTETGAYTLTGNTGIITKNVGATVWIPSENEWYKAAYYDPTKNGTGGYWLSANQSDTMTTNTVGAPGASNYFDGDFAVTQSGSYSSTQNYLTDVGAYGSNAESYYGTNDQAGNVYEWNDAIIAGTSRGQRGGAFNSLSFDTSASQRLISLPTNEFANTGFRVATFIPEPTTFLLGLLSAGALLIRRRRSIC